MGGFRNLKAKYLSVCNVKVDPSSVDAAVPPSGSVSVPVALLSNTAPPRKPTPPNSSTESHNSLTDPHDAVLSSSLKMYSK